MVLLINFIDFERIPKEHNYILNINYEIRKQALLTIRDTGLYSIRYDVFSKGKIVKSEVLNYKLFEEYIKNTISLNLDYNKKYKISFKILDLNSNSYIYDTSLDIEQKSNPHILTGSIKIDKKNYDENDTILKVSIPIYSNIEDTIKLNLRVESNSFVENKLYKFYLAKGENVINFSYDIRKLRLDNYEAQLEISYKKTKLLEKFKFSKTGMLGMTKLEIENVIFALNYLYPNEFMKYLKKNDNDLKKAWDEFWQEKDPTPNTPLNEEKEKFLERYSYVIKNYTRNNKINAMGLIYLKYGPPDYIEKNEINTYNRPYQIWYYESLGLRFVFVDKFGTGDYELAPINWFNDFR
ncbi:MAG: GWxTD domain-containing protein [candidate division WOR-3 bacterium]